MLRHAYHARYELIEFAVYVLAARTQGLVPLHAAAVGPRGRGVLLMGDSGAGKSTIALHCLLQGLEMVSEVGVFVAPEHLLATGIASFLHLRSGALRLLRRHESASRIRGSPIIAAPQRCGKT
jgi:serine kinase of HPr protein (carbohydrate metabolism regulator)